MQTQTQDPAEETKPMTEVKKFTLAAPRGAIKIGVPQDGYWIIAGLPKGGKTDLAASIPGGLILECEEGGADRVAGWVQDIRDLVTFREAFMEALKEPKVKVIIVDTLDEVLKWQGLESAHKYGLESMSDKREGVNGYAVWDDLFTKVERMMTRFKTCGKLVICLAHFKEPKLDSDGKLVITQSIEAPSSKLSSYICSHADVIGVVAKRRVGEKSQYLLRFHGDGVVGAYGSRVPELEDKTIILPKGKQWEAILEAFNAPKPVEEKKAETKKNGRKA